jgi:hypothetical protein
VAFYALHPEETYGWNIPLNAKTIMDKAVAVPAHTGQTELWWKQAGDYVIGGSSGSVVPDSNG